MAVFLIPPFSQMCAVWKCIQRTWLLALWVHLAIASTANSQEISDLSRVDATRLEQYRDQFALDESGSISHGMIRAPNYPIDYSSVLNEETLRSFFEKTVLGCDSVTHYCDDQMYRWSVEEFLVKIFQEGSLLSIENISLVRDPLEYVLAATGISVDFVPDLDDANIVIYVGSIEYVWQKARQNRDAKTLKYFEIVRAAKKEVSLIQRILGKQVVQDQCYTSNKDRSNKGVSAIYVTMDGLESCYARSLMQVIDLHSTDLGVPSATDTTNRYKGLTHFDYFAFNMLNSVDAPIRREVDAINSL
ncbi:hypothetical protein [Roseobacter sinensis]|uniref:Uncharacterized protein n=1 Tax=Roseobacter sinensis TaxID=2931391 RepID=A0ABT3BM52_9RHOB|nr:hypothetical protein [Roseobacter sp. WL0113]MCV3274448.1 hypothetical protein [Roseobacter sp. WL0113]